MMLSFNDVNRKKEIFIHGVFSFSNSLIIQDNLVLSTELSKAFVGANPLTKGLRSKRQLSNLFTVANSHYQLS